MSQPFNVATAEQLVLSVEAVVARGGASDVQFVVLFADIQQDQAEAALNLAVDLGVLQKDGANFIVSSPLARGLAAAQEAHRAAALRVVLESFRPFTVFRERLPAAVTASAAAHQVKVLLDLDAHRDTIRDTLVSLGTYSQALRTEGGGRYHAVDRGAESALPNLAEATADEAAAEAAVRRHVGTDAADLISRDEVLLPLARGLLRAANGDARGAVVHAGNAVESFLASVGLRQGVDLSSAHGINAKVDRLKQAGKIPTKLNFVGKYLGHIRNAADHGTDTEVSSSWDIRPSTGIEYPRVACTFIANIVARERGHPPII